MESYNFENQLKNKLEERRLQPSENAWLRIAAHKKRTKRSPAGWIALVAAVFVAVGLFFMLPGEEINVRQKVVFENTPEPEAKNTPPPTPALSPKAKATIVFARHRNEDIAEHEKESIPEVVKSDISPVMVSAEDQKIGEILASLEKIQHNGQDITEATIDSLLDSARRDLVAERQFKTGTDPYALLSEAESELDQSFKDRVFAAISRFRKIKLALGDKP